MAGGNANRGAVFGRIASTAAGKAAGATAVLGHQIGGNMTISGGITTVQGLLTGSFSWVDVGISAVFGGIGGAVGFKHNGTIWSESFVRNFFVGAGLGFAEGGVTILIHKILRSIRIMSSNFFNKSPYNSLRPGHAI